MGADDNLDLFVRLFSAILIPVLLLQKNLFQIEKLHIFYRQYDWLDF